jgi:hypothetical protein
VARGTRHPRLSIKIAALDSQVALFRLEHDGHLVVGIFPLECAGLPDCLRIAGWSPLDRFAAGFSSPFSFGSLQPASKLLE